MENAVVVAVSDDDDDENGSKRMLFVLDSIRASLQFDSVV